MMDLEHSLRLRYLDAPKERSSICILREIGVTVEACKQADQADIQELGAAHQSEHTAHATITYQGVNDRVFLDVRDSGNAWIRMELSPSVKITMTAGVLRRFVYDPSLPHREIQIYQAHLDQERKRLFLTSEQKLKSLVPRFPHATDGISTNTYHTYRELICELCRQFYTDGWVTGTGGSISIRYGNRIYMTPSGVQKERIEPQDLYMLDIDGTILDAPLQQPGQLKAPKLSDCSPLFLHAYRLRQAGAVLHSHGMVCNLVTVLCEGQTEFRMSHQEMIKGMAGYQYHDTLVIPIIENTAKESDLAESLEAAIIAYPRAHAVLVRRHGIYVWGETWEAAKRHGECLHYLFQVALDMHKLGMDFTIPPGKISNSPCGVEGEVLALGRKRARLEPTPITKSIAEKQQYVLLDIEGTTTPITFVKDVLFPFASTTVLTYLKETWNSTSTQADVQALVKQAELDATDNTLVNCPHVDSNLPQTALIKALVDYVQWNIATDRKMTALKQLQGHIWDIGYSNGQLQSLVYDDVPVFLKRMASCNVRVGIYSSGSRHAQQSLFQYSNQGDLRPWLSIYFDTTVGSKREVSSYHEIKLSVGVERILFVTDILQEAEAAREAGLEVVLSVRPGNSPLGNQHGFRTIHSFDEL